MAGQPDPRTRLPTTRGSSCMATGGAAPGYFDRFLRQLKFSNIEVLARPEEKTDDPRSCSPPCARRWRPTGPRWSK